MVSLDFTLVIQVINFLICLYILKKLIIGPILAIVAKRNSIRSGLTAEAEDFKVQAEAKVQGYEARLAAARADLAAQREELKRQAAEAGAEKMNAANAEARQLRQEAANAREESSSAARQELSGRVQNFAVLAVDRLLGA